MMTKRVLPVCIGLIAILVVLLLLPNSVHADDFCPAGQHPEYVNGSVVCVIDGNNTGTEGPTSVPPDVTPQETPVPACIPDGSVHIGNVIRPVGNDQFGPNRCQTWQAWFDNCNNFLDLFQPIGPTIPCVNPTAVPPQPPGPSDCDPLIYDGNSFSCSWNFQWHLEARVSMPPIVIDVQPYPATLVTWPTTFRVNGVTANSGSGTLAYAGWGGGYPGNSRDGDWRNITLTMTFRPTGSPITVNLSRQPSFTVPSSGGTRTLTWDVASHPAVGAYRTAGGVGQLNELPSDMTLFQGNSMTTYRLYYTMTYQEYDVYYVCGDQPTPTPRWPTSATPRPYTCQNWVPRGNWIDRSRNGEFPPSAVVNLPASMNGGDVYNDWTVVIRRMDESGNVNNPAYAHSYSWGSIWYFAVREGQGQIGWPGLP